MPSKHNDGPPRAWQRMLSGRRLNLLDPSPLDVEIEDIAHGLARVARWNGQTSGPNAFSVAQHCLLVEDIMGRLDPALSWQTRLLALLHDAPEYVIGDMISPFKATIGDRYKAVEQRLSASIHRRFSLPPEPNGKERTAIKQADRIAAYFEAVHLAGFSRDEAGKIFGVPRGVSLNEANLQPLPTADAQNAFLNRFRECEGEAVTGTKSDRLAMTEDRP